jgi:Zn-dependent protease with chaperone function
MAAHRGRRVPDREQIRAALAATNTSQRWLFVLWPAVAVGALLLTDWAALAERPLIAFLAVGVAVGGALSGVVMLAGRNKRWIEDLAPDRQLGNFRRDELVELVAEVHGRLGIRRHTPTALTGDKDLNASIMLLGLGGWFPKLEAIYLHRPMLHVLSRDELATVIGHELGHYHRYKVAFARSTALQLATMAAVSLALVSWLSFDGLELMAVAGVASAERLIVGFLGAGHQRNIEFLCDEAGAEVGGAVAHVNVELKLALEAETTRELQRLLITEGHGLPVSRLLALYEEALPFSRPDPDELARLLRERLTAERRLRQDGSISLGGFARYLYGLVTDETAVKADDPALRAALDLPDVPLLPWDRDTFRNQGGFDEAQIDALVSLMLAHPELPLAKLPEEVDPRVATTHPPVSQRILYIWTNRAAIRA